MMLEPEDFTLPLEKELRLRVIKIEVDECTDVKHYKKISRLAQKV